MNATLRGNRATGVAATAALGIALVSGIAADLLLRTNRLGLNLWLLSAVFLALLLWLRRRFQLPARREPLVLLGISSLFLLSFAWRDAPALNFLALLASFTTAGLAAWTAQGANVLLATPGRYITALFWSGFGTMVGCLPLALKDADWSPVVPAGRSSAFARVALGVALAIPPVLVFGSLFASADPIFSSVSRQLFAFDVEKIVSHLALVLIIGWGVAGYLRQLVLPARQASTDPSRIGAIRLGHLEVMVILGAVCLVFLAFVSVQLRALFGGDQYVISRIGLSYAEYARQGFFQLTWAAALVLPMLLFLDWAHQRDTGGKKRQFRWVSLLLLGLLCLVLVSAMQRMRIYQVSYGLTELRVYTVAFMLWLAPVVIWFGATILTGRRERFVPGVLILAASGILLLHLVNPDRLIARTNLERSFRGLPFDAGHAATLSDDAAPVLLAALDRVDHEAQCMFASRFNRTPDEWRSWNLARFRARTLADTLQPRLERIMASCSGKPKEE